MMYLNIRFLLRFMVKANSIPFSRTIELIQKDKFLEHF